MVAPRVINELLSKTFCKPKWSFFLNLQDQKGFQTSPRNSPKNYHLPRMLKERANWKPVREDDLDPPKTHPKEVPSAIFCLASVFLTATIFTPFTLYTWMKRTNKNHSLTLVLVPLDVVIHFLKNDDPSASSPNKTTNPTKT